MIELKRVGSVCSDLLGSLCSDLVGSILGGQVGSISLKFPRYHIDKVLQQLELNWNVLTYSTNIRGMYVAMENKIRRDLLFISK